MRPRTRMTGPLLAGMAAGLAMLVMVAVAAAMCGRGTEAVPVRPVEVAPVADTVAVAARPDSAAAGSRPQGGSAKKRRPAAVRPGTRDYLDEVVTGRSAPAGRDTRGQ